MSPLILATFSVYPRVCSSSGANMKFTLCCLTLWTFFSCFRLHNYTLMRYFYHGVRSLHEINTKHYKYSLLANVVSYYSCSSFPTSKHILCKQRDVLLYPLYCSDSWLYPFCLLEMSIPTQAQLGIHLRFP